MSQAKIYVGNLAYSTSDQDLKDLFSKFGEIEDVRIITDRESGRSKGFGFVTFTSAQSAQDSLAADGTEFQGRKIRVNIANDDSRRSSGGGAGRGGRPGGRPGGSGGGYRSGSSRGDN